VHGITHVSFVQSVNGVPLLNAGVRVNVTRDGRIVNVVGAPVSILANVATSPGLTAEQALAAALSDVGGTVLPFTATHRGDTRRTAEFSTGDRAALGLYATTEGVRLGWETFVRAGSAQFRTVVDAAGGQVLFRRSLTQDATGLVFENYPGAAKGGTQRPYDLTGLGWLPTGSKYLSGPNAHVWTDLNDDNVANQTEEINPSSLGNNDRDWLWPLQRFAPAVAGCDVWVCSWNPDKPGSWAANEDQSGQQLFVLLNKFHDHLEAAPMGFDNVAGNFEGDDVVLGNALDGAKVANNLPDGNHIDNANMATPPDGQSPTMQMYLFRQPFAGTRTRSSPRTARTRRTSSTTSTRTASRTGS
jgi:extracellular elastinolytic metalloproteinase